MLYGVIELVGKLLHHVLGVLLLCWQRMLRFGLSVGVLSFLMAEVLGSALTRQFPPSILTTVVALIISCALGYAAALTALADELFLSAVDTIRLLEGEARAGFRAATVAAEREAGEARQGLLRWLGHPPARGTRAAAGAVALAARRGSPAQPATPEQAETLEAIAATDSFQSTAPRPRVNARPVRADQLPRIPWAYEQDAVPSSAHALAPTPAFMPAVPAVAAVDEPEPAPVSDMPPLPLRVPDAAPLAAPDAALVEPESLAAPDEPYPGSDDPAATLPAAHKPASSAPALAPSVYAAAETPAIPAIPAAPAPDASASGDRSIWARIGQALVGNTMPLAALGGTHAVAPSGPRVASTDASDGQDAAERSPGAGQTSPANPTDAPKPS